MSKKQLILFVQPPMFPKEQPVERMELGGFKCTYCHGNGWFWGIRRVRGAYKAGMPCLQREKATESSRNN